MRRGRFPALRAAAAVGLLLGLLAGCAGPAPTATPAYAEVSPGAKPGPLLWRAVPPQPEAGELYLFGSVHVGGPEPVAYGTEVEIAFAAADELVVEVDVSGLAEEEITQRALDVMRLPEGQRLREQVSPATWELLVERLGGEDAPALAAVERLKPWAVTTFLAMQQFAAAGLEERYGIDKDFLGRAEDLLPVRGLETLEQQLAVLDGLAPEIQELMLRDTLQRGEEDPSALLLAWERGDEAELDRILFEPLAEYPEYAPFYDALFFSRNVVMAAQLAELAQDGRRRFVVLGAGHMVGARGVPALLHADGFRVVRLSGQ